MCIRDSYYTMDVTPGPDAEEGTDIAACLNDFRNHFFSNDFIKNAIVRVHYECTDTQAKLINQAQITRDLYDLGAFYVQGVEAKVRRETRTRAAEANAGMTPTEALAMWARVNSVDDGELDKLSTRAEVLLQEVGM